MNAKLVIGAPMDKRDPLPDARVDYLDSSQGSSDLGFTGKANIYVEAGAAVAELAQQIHAHLPCSNQPQVEAGIASFLFSAQFTWAQDAIPKLRANLAKAESYTEVDLWDCPLPDPSIHQLCGSTQAIARRASDPQPALATLLQDYQQKMDSAQPAQDPAAGLPLVVLGSQVDLTLGAAYLNHLAVQGPCHLLLKRNDPQLASALEQQCPQLQVQEVFFTHRLTPTQLGSCRQLWQEYQQLPEPVATLLAPSIGAMVQALWNAQALQDLITTIAPRLVFGTFEKSPLGVVLSNPNTPGDYELVSYQHGILSTTQTLHHFNFQRFFLWNDLFKQLVLQDGYQPQGSIEVLDLRPSQALDPTFHPLHLVKPGWAKRGLVLAIFEQPLQKSPLNPEDYGALLVELDRLAALQGFSCVVKPHPATQNDKSLSDLANNLPRVQRLSAEVSLEQVLIHADMALGMTSTALLDFMRVGKPAISFDAWGWYELAGIPADLFSRKASNYEELAARLKELTQASTPWQRLRSAWRLRRPI